MWLVRHLFAVFFILALCKGILAADYFPVGYFDPTDVTKVTWAHGVNSKADLASNLKDDSIQMLEADIVIGTITGSNGSIIPIMAHPPATESDLSFAMFLDEVIYYNINLTLKERKGIKLDFKDFQAAEIAAPILKQKRDQNLDLVNFPIWINADILKGPINASESKVDGKQLIKLQTDNSPQSTLSLGWTTKFGLQSSGEVLTDGSYSRAQMDEMITLINETFLSQTPENVEITFPLRAGLALNSVENVKYLLDESGINFASLSITLWEGATDSPLDLDKLNAFIKDINQSRVFVDLPHSLNHSGAGWTVMSGRLTVLVTILHFLFVLL